MKLKISCTDTALWSKFTKDNYFSYVITEPILYTVRIILHHSSNSLVVHSSHNYFCQSQILIALKKKRILKSSRGLLPHLLRATNMQCLCDCFTRRNRLDHKAEDKQRTVQAHARTTSHVKQKVIKHRKGNKPWSVWDQKAEEEAHRANAGLNSSQRTSAIACI